ncbi:MAG: single-stranded DNA-binding protein [Clostridiales bacterium]|jgi:single-strand DNA-binding protein|nr:single-stranded DNA-binding protein [Clostridiales bacterium]
MNKVVLMGRLTRDPEVRYSQGDTPVAVARYTLAVNRRFKRDNEPDADFINCVAFGKSGEFAEKYFRKGIRIVVSGSLRVSSWEDQNGQKRWGTDVIIDEQEFAESKSTSDANASRQGGFDQFLSMAENMPQNSFKEDTSAGFTPISEAIDDDDLPF